MAVVGPSGSGKSTLLLMLGGMLSPTSGRVLLEGQSIYDLSLEPAGKVEKAEGRLRLPDLQPGLVSFRVGEREGPAVSGRHWTTARRNERATALLERVGLADRLHHKPCELSVGQQQRVALARMLANDPAVILADEPTGNLDPETTQQVIEFLEEVNREGRTIVMVTHDPRAAQRAKRTLRLAGRRHPFRAEQIRENLHVG